MAFALRFASLAGFLLARRIHSRIDSIALSAFGALEHFTIHGGIRDLLSSQPLQFWFFIRSLAGHNFDSCYIIYFGS